MSSPLRKIISVNMLAMMLKQVLRDDAPAAGQQQFFTLLCRGVLLLFIQA